MHAGTSYPDAPYCPQCGGKLIAKRVARRMAEGFRPLEVHVVGCPYHDGCHLRLQESPTVSRLL